MIEAFVWSDRFASGIESVDSQHQQLFRLINQVGDLLVGGAEVSEAATEALIKKLADYARFHFTDEERVMTEGGLDPAYIDSHKKIHTRFTEQVVSMWKGRAGLVDPARTLYGFLSSWLVYHILGEDQKMAREITRVRGGTPAVEANRIESDHGEASSTALLQAMTTLYDVVSEQNRDLVNGNLELETRVTERTGELKVAYAKLAADHQELTELLGKVEAAQSQLLQSEKMASIGQLAAGVAHEINNPDRVTSIPISAPSGGYVEELLRLAVASRRQCGAQAIVPEHSGPARFSRDDIKAI
jgi:hemerythrin-like metal-binding protein